MRKLTLDEKISLKGLLANKGLILPRLTTKEAVNFWNMCYGCSISRWHTVRRWLK